MPVTDPINDFLSLLRGVVSDGQGKWKAYCPVHESSGEHDPSLGITTGDDGRVLLKCLACSATQVEIVHAAGSTMSKLFPPREKGKSQKKPGYKKVADYVYRDSQGIVVYRAERWENKEGQKDFRQSRPN